MDSEQSAQYFDHCPWAFSSEASDAQRLAQRTRQESVPGDTVIGQRCYVAESAAVFPDRLRLGDDSYIAAQAYVTGELATGSDCTVNPFAVVRGTVTLGSGVRIGAHSSLLGFNHGMAPDRPVFQQPHTSKGIIVGDDVWIGSHVVVLDGVSIGDHCVIGAGAVVTKDLPTWSMAAGNPARRLRDRRDVGSRPATKDTDALARFGERVRAQAADVLGRCFIADRFVDRPGTEPTVRAHCDAVELADLLLGSTPEQMSAGEHVEQLTAAQDPRTGLVPEIGQGLPDLGEDGFPASGPELYHVLSVGYALDVLGARLPYPVRAAQHMSPQRLVARLDRLPWHDGAWSAGSWIDAFATAARWNASLVRRPGGDDAPAEPLETLFGWLLTRVDRWTGMWGTPSPQAGRLQVVNGYYRLTRGTFAQFGLPVPYPQRVVDTVLDHTRDTRFFGPGRANACNVLDVVHPLWLSTRQLGDGTGPGSYRQDEIHRWAEQQLAAALARWQDGQGFGFGAGTEGPGPEPGLQGTEMWLAIIWYLADLLGRSDALGYRPRGVHRPEPAVTTAAGVDGLTLTVVSG